MRPKANQLAMRDPALASLLGVMPGSDFGAEFGGGYDPNVGADWGADIGDEYGVEFGDDAPAAMPTKQAALAAWKNQSVQRAHSTRRGMLLEPNKGSAIKVERYTFSVNQALTLGIALALTTMTGQPDTNIRPQRVTMNAPTPGFATITELKVANVSVTVGGIADAFQFSAQAVGQTLDMPTLSPANRATVLGAYTGFVPPGFVGGSPYLFTASFTGPASIVA
jgi:hypothetical protein